MILLSILICDFSLENCSWNHKESMEGRAWFESEASKRDHNF
jgi:hypothetical protein